MKAKHKDLIKDATHEQWEAAEQAYIEHLRVCVEMEVLPSDFGPFFAEWLEYEDKPEAEQ